MPIERHLKRLSRPTPVELLDEARGLTGGDRLLLLACGGATVGQLAAIMQALGCQEAMNLDGGAPRGLWFKGKYLVKPGRALSNALLILPRC